MDLNTLLAHGREFKQRNPACDEEVLNNELRRFTKEFSWWNQPLGEILWLFAVIWPFLFVLLIVFAFRHISDNKILEKAGAILKNEKM